MSSAAASSDMPPQSDVGLDGDFDGASGASQREPTLDHQCAECGGKYGFYSHLAYLWKRDKMFAQLDNSAISRAKELTQKGGTFTNKFEEESVFLACWKCCENFHEKAYRGPNGKLTSHWVNCAKATKRIRFRVVQCW
jgi:hypothetical protein